MASEISKVIGQFALAPVSAVFGQALLMVANRLGWHPQEQLANLMGGALSSETARWILFAILSVAIWLGIDFLAYRDNSVFSRIGRWRAEQPIMLGNGLMMIGGALLLVGAIVRFWPSAASAPSAVASEQLETMSVAQSPIIFGPTRFFEPPHFRVTTYESPDGSFVNSYSLAIGISAQDQELKNVRVIASKIPGAGLIGEKELPPYQTPRPVNIPIGGAVYFSLLSGWTKRLQPYSKSERIEIATGAYDLHLQKHAIIELVDTDNKPEIHVGDSRAVFVRAIADELSPLYATIKLVGTESGVDAEVTYIGGEEPE